VPSRSECHRRSGWSGGPSFVVVVKATDFWNLDDLPRLSALDVTRLRALPVQREMGTPVVVVAEVAPPHTPQMILVEHDDVIQTLPPDAADQSLRIGVLPGALGGCHHLLEAHAPHTVAEARAVRPVPISQYVVTPGNPIRVRTA